MDNKLKKAIKNFYGSISLGEAISPASMSILLENNMIFPAEEMDHDELVMKLRNEMLSADKSQVVASFLSGLEQNKPQERAALSAYAIAFNFPKHTFQSVDDIQCKVCGCFKKREINFTLSNLARYTVGSCRSGSPEQLYLFLREHNRSPKASVSSVNILLEILKVLRISSPQDTPSIVEGKIRALPGVVMTKEESRGLLDLLGQIGVLESPEHKGFIHEYKNIGVMPRKTRSSDWSYPVDFWKGEHGVNEDAVEFWFGCYVK